METTLSIIITPLELSTSHQLVCKSYFNFVGTSFEQRIEYALIKDLFYLFNAKNKIYSVKTPALLRVSLKLYLVLPLQKILAKNTQYNNLNREENLALVSLQSKIQKAIL